MANATEPEPPDDALLEWLAEMLDATEPLSNKFVAQTSRDAFTSRSLDAELAELVHDSTVAGGMRGAETRELIYEAGDTRVVVRFSEQGDVRLSCTPAEGEWSIEDSEGQRPISLDELGRCTLPPVTGRLRVIWTIGTKTATTGWTFS